MTWHLLVTWYNPGCVSWCWHTLEHEPFGKPWDVETACMRINRSHCICQGSLANTLREIRPTAFMGVPRVWEKMQEKMKSIGAKSSTVRRKVASWAKDVGLQTNLNKRELYVHTHTRTQNKVEIVRHKHDHQSLTYDTNFLLSVIYCTNTDGSKSLRPHWKSLGFKICFKLVFRNLKHLKK